MADRYLKEERPADYDHSFHAGNIGDVWKHVVLTEILSRLTSGKPPISVLDTHAGSGIYDLGSTGEWTEGIGRIAELKEPVGAVARYLELVNEAGFVSEKRRYPGSPWIVRNFLREGDRAVFCDTSETAVNGVRRVLEDDARMTIVKGDGFTSLAEGREWSFVHVDPPWREKRDWEVIPQTIQREAVRLPEATFMMWYPIKSYTRVAAMIKRWRESGVAAVALDLITTPLEHQRNRLNGSGIILCNPPSGTVEAACGYGATLGKVGAIMNRRWELRVEGN